MENIISSTIFSNTPKSIMANMIMYLLIFPKITQKFFQSIPSSHRPCISNLYINIASGVFYTFLSFSHPNFNLIFFLNFYYDITILLQLHSLMLFVLCFILHLKIEGRISDTEVYFFFFFILNVMCCWCCF